MSQPEQRTAQWVALTVALGGGAALVVLAGWLVPWHPVPGGAPDPVSASAYFTGAEIARAEQYSRWSRLWGYASLAVSLVVASWFGFTRHGRGLVERLGGPWWVRVLLAVTALGLLGRLLTLPFAVLLRRHRLDFGLTNQSATGFAVDLLKNEVLTIAVTSGLVLMVMACARRWRRAWPAVAGALVAAFVLIGSFVYPLVVEPVFNDFESLPPGGLRTAILELAQREEVPLDDVLVADASRRTTTLNAYVSGFGSTRRVVLYDNLVAELDQDAALAVVAHELAHARHRDVVTGTTLGAVGGAAGVGLLGLVVMAGGARTRVRMQDPAVVPLVLAVLALGSVVSAPVENVVSRRIETRADADALRAGDVAAFVDLQVSLSRESLADLSPPRWSQLWFGSHPTVLERIAIAERVEVSAQDGGRSREVRSASP